MARGLEVARELSSRVEGAEARDAELAAKLAAVGGTMPVLTTQVKAVEKKVRSRGPPLMTVEEGRSYHLVKCATLIPPSQYMLQER